MIDDFRRYADETLSDVRGIELRRTLATAENHLDAQITLAKMQEHEKKHREAMSRTDQIIQELMRSYDRAIKMIGLLSEISITGLDNRTEAPSRLARGRLLDFDG